MRKLLIYISFLFIITLNSCIFYTNPYYDDQCGTVINKYINHNHRYYHNCYYDYYYYITIKNDNGYVYDIQVTQYTYYNTYIGEYVCLN